MAVEELEGSLIEGLEPGRITRLPPGAADSCFELHYDPPPRGVVVQARALRLDLPPERVWRVVEAIGGDNGWYYWNWAWTVRGWLDRLIGGIGNRRGRPQQLATGAYLDSWVVTHHTDKDLTLLSRWRMQRLARLGFHVRPCEGGAVLLQWVEFHPTVLTWLYWWAAYPLHEFVFRGILRVIARRAAE